MSAAVSALKRRQGEIEREIASLQAELLRVTQALAVLTAADLFQDSEQTPRRRAGGSLKQMAYTVLHEAGQPLTANQILEKIAAEFGQRIERTSLSPQLSRLGSDHFLKRQGNVWSIDERRLSAGKEFYLLKVKGDLI